MAELGDYLEQYSYEYLLQTALDRVPADVDKRQGSIIYDALAPACYMLAAAFLTMRQIYRDTYAGTATADYLDKRTRERGVIRNTATKAIRKGVFTDAGGNPVVIAIGTRFSTLGAATYTYAVTEEIVMGQYLLECEQTGAGGNSYVGEILPISYIEPLASAQLLDIVIPAEDLESDDDLRSRYLSEIGNVPFAGNVAAYNKMLEEIDGVGGVQVYPIWLGGGSVKLSVIDSTYAPANGTFISILQNKIDPSPSGTGLGLAPIGHTVTVTAPTTVRIDITATVTLKGGTTLSIAQNQAISEISDYIMDLKKTWGLPDNENNYSANVYISQITAAILRSPSVANASNVKINGAATDKILLQSADFQQLPTLGTVVLSG